MTTPTIRDATEQDIATLAPFAAELFTERFGHRYRPENLAKHLAATCSPEYFHHALERGDHILLMELDGKLIGYGKMGRVDVPAPKPIPPGALELHRAYLLPEYRSKGLGKSLMIALMGLPQAQVAPVIYLGVWEENIHAQALYAQYGFAATGRYLYYVGDESDREIIMEFRHETKLKPKPKLKPKAKPKPRN